jgi:dimethylamine monooxygenase subunit C
LIAQSDPAIRSRSVQLEGTETMTSTNTSRPTYVPLEADPHGTQHWFVTSGATDADRARAEAALSRAVPLEVWAVGAVASQAGAERRFDDEGALLAALEPALRDAKIGLRIYALGSEPFIWSVRQLGERFALAREAVKLAHSGSLHRRVYCIHCRTLNEGVTSNVAECGGCKRSLFVRDHFSRRLAAFMGVQVDAEKPGELPQPEQLYL